MPVAQSPAHYMNNNKGCPSITESFPHCFLLLHEILLLPLARHCQWYNPILEKLIRTFLSFLYLMIYPPWQRRAR
jgi:hypothetical protein